MRHIEASAKITPTQPVDTSTVKYSFVQRLRGAFHVETVGDGNENFSVTATSKTTSYTFTLGIVLKTDPERIRMMIEGSNDVSMATKIFYILSVFVVLGLSLVPGALDPKGGNGALVMEAMFFLVAGGFIIYDYNKKMDEPQLFIERILRSIDAEFG